MSCKVSVIIPVYNLEHYIERCIDSVLLQTFGDFEIICVDDCSSDDSVQIIKKISSLDARVKLFQHQENLGPAIARNLGCKNAEGDYLFFLDGDDTLPLNALEVLYEAAIKTNADLVRGRVMKFELNKSQILLPIDELPYGCGRIGIYRALLEGKYRHNLWATLYRRELFVNYSYREHPKMRNGEDAYLFYQIVENVKNGIEIIPSVVYFYYMNPTSSTHIKLSSDALDGLLIFHKYVTSIDYQDKYLEILSLRTSTKMVHYHALRNGFNRVEKSINKIGAPPFLSMRYRIKYIPFCDLIIFYVRVLFLRLKQFVN